MSEMIETLLAVAAVAALTGASVTAVTGPYRAHLMARAERQRELDAQAENDVAWFRAMADMPEALELIELRRAVQR